MAGFNPNQPRDEIGRWTDAYTRIPESERLKSAAVSVLVFDDPEDVYAEAMRSGIEPEIDPEFGVVRGYYDFDKKKIVCSLWDGYENSPKNFYHEFAHSIVGSSEDAVAAWMEAFAEEEV